MATNYNSEGPRAPRQMRLIFGIFMILVYLGIGLLFILYPTTIIYNATISFIVGGILCAYGVFRGYRLYKGIN